MIKTIKKDYLHISANGIHVVDEDGDEVRIDKHGIRVNSEEDDTFVNTPLDNIFKENLIKINVWMYVIEPILFLVVTIVYLIL